MIDCKYLATIRKQMLKEYIRCNDLRPHLAVIQVGNDPASNAYVKGKAADCKEVGIEFHHYLFPESVTTEVIVELINNLNSTSFITGIIVQLPLPKHLDKVQILNSIADEKDVDGFKANSKFTPCTPKGVMEIIDECGAGVDGKVCCVIGRGEVGKPMVDLLTKHNATVIWCNSHTSPLDRYLFIKNADVVISATGVPNLIGQVYTGQLVIDVGISRGEDGKLHGDVNPKNYADYMDITPVPGGVGLMTRVALLENVVYGCGGNEK